VKFQNIIQIFYQISQATNKCPFKKGLIFNFFGKKIKYMYIYRKTTHNGMFPRLNALNPKCLPFINCNFSTSSTLLAATSI